MIIESVNNPKVKNWMKLKEKKYRDQEGLFLIEGDHLLKESLKANLVREIIAGDESFKVDNVPFYLVSEGVLKKLSSQVSSTKVIAVVEKIKTTKIVGDVCILDNIQDPGNLGAIIRSAVAFNISNLIMSADTVDLYNEKVIRASEGMIFKLNYQRGDLTQIIADLKKDGYQIWGTDVSKGVNLKEIQKEGNVAIIIGNEGQGMNPKYKDVCDKLINIKISHDCESLNASVAASIIFYQMME